MKEVSKPITNMSEANQRLKQFVPPARKFREAVVSLKNMRRLMTHLGNPQHEYKIVHVAGSSGKTSTAHFAAALLTASGKRVGLTVSPHIDSVTERMQINLRPLDEELFCERLSEFLDVIKPAGVQPTYFELLVAFAYWNFAREKVDYAVVEVGLGGLLDATNVVKRPDKLCVITDIGLDHTELLGHTLGEIASQKAGIIREHNTVFCYQQSEEVMQVIREVAEQVQAELHEVQQIVTQDLAADLSLYQQRNWHLAYCAYEQLRERDGLDTLSDSQLAATTHVYIPARMELVRLGSKVLVLDGAHNPQKMQQFMRSLRQKFPDEPIAMLIGLLKSKRTKVVATLGELIPQAEHVVVTSFNTRQDMRKLSIDPLKVGACLNELGFVNWEIEPDAAAALQRLLDRPERVLVITGSFYLFNQIRPLLKELQ